MGSRCCLLLPGHRKHIFPIKTPLTISSSSLISLEHLIYNTSIISQTAVVPPDKITNLLSAEKPSLASCVLKYFWSVLRVMEDSP